MRVREFWVSMFKGTRAFTVSPPGTRAAEIPATCGNGGKEDHSHQSRNQLKCKSLVTLGVILAARPVTRERGCRGIAERTFGTPLKSPGTRPPKSTFRR